MADVVKETVIAEGYEGFVPPPGEPVRLTPEQTLARDAGPGFVSDLIKMSGGNFGLTNEQARDAGAGFIGDLLRAQVTGPQPGPDPAPGEEPTLNSINPNSADVGSDDLTVSVNGSHFTDTSLVYFDGQPVETIFVANGQVRFTVHPLQELAPRQAEVWVQQGSVRTEQAKMFNFTAV